MAENAKWYVVHTYSGYENTVAASIEKAVENRGLRDLIFVSLWRPLLKLRTTAPRL